jgi:hypothetical protein
MTAPDAQPLRCYLGVEALSEWNHPAFVERDDSGRCRGVYVVVHVWADRYDLLRFLSTELTIEEFAAYREAFGWPEGMVPTEWLEEEGPMAVPASLWLPKRAALA